MTKVTLYNQVLQRYHVLSGKHVKEPVCVVAMNESMPAAAAVAAAGAVGAHSSGIEIMQAKARRLMERLKRYIAWTARGELIHEGVSFAAVDLVSDLLRKRKTDPTGLQPFAQQIRTINLPMELVGNVARRSYMRQTRCTKITQVETPRSSARPYETFDAHSTTGTKRFVERCV